MSDKKTKKKLGTQLDAFSNPVKEESEPKNMLYDLILKVGYLLTDKIVINELAENGNNFYSIIDGKLIIVYKQPLRLLNLV